MRSDRRHEGCHDLGATVRPIRIGQLEDDAEEGDRLGNAEQQNMSLTEQRHSRSGRRAFNELET